MTTASNDEFANTTQRLSDSIGQALEILSDERDAFLTGAYDRIARITELKLSLLERLEIEIRSAPRSGDVIDMIKRLIDASRRNEQIIEAARQGLAYARRRIARIEDAQGGAVAYSEDGDKIVSRADVLGQDKSM
ncbi:MAG: hypothetical protein AAF557_12350 [Pseudomonadota bacterium]